MHCQKNRAGLCFNMLVVVLLSILVGPSCARIPGSPTAESPSTAEAIISPRNVSAIPDALFVVLSADQTRLLAAYAGNPQLEVLRQLPPSSKAQVSFYPADFPVISDDGIWVTVLEDEARQSECVYKVPLVGSDEPRCVLNWPGIQQEASISSDGARIAFLATEDSPIYPENGEIHTGPQHIYVMDANGDNVKRVTSQPADICFLSWSPNAEQLAYREVCDPAASELPQVYVLTLNSFNTVKTETQITASGAGTTWLPDGNWLQWWPYHSAGGSFGEPRLSQLDSDGQIVEEVSVDHDGVWSPDARKLAWITREQVLMVWDRASDEVTSAQLMDVQYALPMKWLGDGERVVFAGYNLDDAGQKIGEHKWFVVNVDGSDLTEFSEP